MSDSQETVGQLVRRWRKAAGLTQSQLGERMGMGIIIDPRTGSPGCSQLSRLERDKGEPVDRTLRRIAAAFPEHGDPEDLFQQFVAARESIRSQAQADTTSIIRSMVTLHCVVFGHDTNGRPRYIERRSYTNVMVNLDLVRLGIIRQELFADGLDSDTEHLVTVTAATLWFPGDKSEMFHVRETPEQIMRLFGLGPAPKGA